MNGHSRHLRLTDVADEGIVQTARGVEDFDRANCILEGAKGKRLTYRWTDEADDGQAEG